MKLYYCIIQNQAHQNINITAKQCDQIWRFIILWATFAEIANTF